MSATVSPVTAQAQEQRGTVTSAYTLFLGTWQIGAYFWIAVATITVAVAYVIDRWGDLESSTGDGFLGSAPAFLGVMGLIMPPSILTLHVVGGATRRSLFRGTIVAAVGLGITFALLGAIGMLVESLVLDALDLPTVTLDAHLYDSSGDFFGIWLSWSLSGLSYFLGGAAIAFGYYRWGALLGTVQTIGVVLLVLGADMLMGGGPSPQVLGGVESLSAVLLVSLSLLASAVVALILYLTLRDIPLKGNPASS
ncbi:hypothetical protein KV102_00950 [Mumia sp. zg.B53]|uniref:hypothetical protein n=1 Tax=unclassified Mumia TaxID=2621872 RepID=UPI001C6DF30A|nr:MULTISPECIES: hypothetical protein [unclassified Mumia]MBW9208784.1 hypothetical protein [Mumia sp. zg.B21]MBW9213395.1 hypothetical protein [Mumia sp. zg.B53]